MFQTESESKNPNSLELESSKAPAKVHWNPKHPRQSTDLSGSRLVTGSTLERGLSPGELCFVFICHGFLRLHVCFFFSFAGGWWMLKPKFKQPLILWKIPRHQAKFGQEWYPCLAYLPIYTWLYLAYMLMTNVRVLSVNIPYIDNMG